MKNIETLVDDLYRVMETGRGWGNILSEQFGREMEWLAQTRINAKHRPERKNALRMSNLGDTCTRKLWYEINFDLPREQMTGKTLTKFFYGDMLEALLVHLAIASGHEVVGMQDEMVYEGVVGHRDVVIDGVTVDVKSANSRSFQKFKNHNLREDDPFGYLRQLTGYVAAAKDDPLVTDKTGGAFLAIDKENGEIVLDYYDLSDYISTHKEWTKDRKAAVAQAEPPERSFEPVADGKSGNMKLPTKCSYCSFKKPCWPEARLFLYSNGPRWLTTVEREPDVTEVIE